MRRPLIRPLRTAAAATAALVLLPAVAAAENPSDEILLRRAPGVTAAEVAQARSDAGVRLVDRPLPGVERVVVADGDRAAALSALRRDPDVAWAEPNQVTRAATTVTDPYFPLQWALENTGSLAGTATTLDADIDASAAWPTSTGTGITVAVVDSGVAADHPDLAGRIVAGHDFIYGGDDVSDGNGHGTHVSGIIAADANAIGTVGVAPSASIEPLRVLNAAGIGTTASSAAAFDLAGTQGVRVVNASIAAPLPTSAELLAIQRHPDTLYVVASGNDGVNIDGGTASSYPCAYAAANLLCVGASDWNDAPTSYSNRGRLSVDLFAPGDRIYSTAPPATYQWMSGTSMAAPMVAGTAALLAAARPSLTALQIKDLLLDTVDHPAALAGLSVSGGRLNAAAALAAAGTSGAADDEAPPPPAEVTARAGDGQVQLSWVGVDSPDLAGYRVYQSTGGAEFLPVGEVGLATDRTLDGLLNDTEYAFRVTAVDAHGNESSPSATVSATPQAPAPAPAPAEAPAAPPARTSAAPSVVTPPAARTAPVAPTPTRTAGGRPTPKASRSTVPTVAALRVRGRATGRRSSRARLEVTLSARARVKLTLQRRVCRRHHCRYRSVGYRMLTLGAGRRRLSITTRLAGLSLRPGLWRARVTTSAGTRSVTFRVAR